MPGPTRKRVVERGGVDVSGFKNVKRVKAGLSSAEECCCTISRDVEKQSAANRYNRNECGMIPLYKMQRMAHVVA